MQILVRGPDERTHTVQLGETATVGELKAYLAPIVSLASVDQVLSANSHMLLDDAKTLLDYALVDECTVDVTSRLLGGKVHGSLARAGKVRGQTPKVDKQEKKKKKVGRALRRMQYNRRFVNVAVGPGGRRRGPNSNADKA